MLVFFFVFVVRIEIDTKNTVEISETYQTNKFLSNYLRYIACCLDKTSNHANIQFTSKIFLTLLTSSYD